VTRPPSHRRTDQNKNKPIGGHEGMRPVCWSQPSADEDVALREIEGKPVQGLPEPTPAEEPGVFVEQPFERWSPRDLLVSVARAVRSTGAAIVRGTVTS
jgi:hypothetical protein